MEGIFRSFTEVKVMIPHCYSTSVQVKVFTIVQVFGRLTGVTTPVGAAFLLSRTFSVMIATLHAGCCEAAGSLRRWTAALFHRQDGLEELTAGHTLPVLLGKHPLNGLEED